MVLPRRFRHAMGSCGKWPGLVERALAYFKEHGGFCDCQILFNVEALAQGDDDGPGSALMSSAGPRIWACSFSVWRR